MSKVFLMGSKVRFTHERLSILTPRDRQGLAERVGLVQTDGNVVNKPTVYFPEEGAKPELRLFRVDPRHLELVESPLPSETTTRIDGGTNIDRNDNSETVASEGDGRLSQSDMDNLFG